MFDCLNILLKPNFLKNRVRLFWIFNSCSFWVNCVFCIADPFCFVFRLLHTQDTHSGCLSLLVHLVMRIGGKKTRKAKGISCGPCTRRRTLGQRQSIICPLKQGERRESANDPIMQCLSCMRVVLPLLLVLKVLRLALCAFMFSQSTLNPA